MMHDDEKDEGGTISEGALSEIDELDGEEIPESDAESEEM